MSDNVESRSTDFAFNLRSRHKVAIMLFFSPINGGLAFPSSPEPISLVIAIDPK